jgi:hypothetical protein
MNSEKVEATEIKKPKIDFHGKEREVNLPLV